MQAVAYNRKGDAPAGWAAKCEGSGGIWDPRPGDVLVHINQSVRVMRSIGERPMSNYELDQQDRRDTLALLDAKDAKIEQLEISASYFARRAIRLEDELKAAQAEITRLQEGAA